MSYIDDDFDYYDNEYYDIIDSTDPENIWDVSNLRHYINCHGKTKELRRYLNMDNAQIDDIVEYCYGSIEIRNLKKNYKNIIRKCKAERKAKEEALKKNEELVESLRDYRKSMCGVGTRRVKLFLNKKAKSGDIIAKTLRLALEIEDINISAKDSYWKYQDRMYKKKNLLITDMIKICQENNYVYGYQKSDVKATSHIIYFELPHCEQISFHCDLEKLDGIPVYEKEWDKKINSTLPKIEKAVLDIYKSI